VAPTAPPVVLSSRQNPRFRSLVKLVSSARGLRAANLCVLEGEHLISQFVGRGVTLETLVIASVSGDSPGISTQFSARETLLIPAAQFGSLSDLASPPKCIALASIPSNPTIPAAQFEPFSVLILDRIQDPSNVGALLRTAAAAGVREAWLTQGCAYAWSQKTLRASQGTQCNLIVRENVDVVAELAKFNGQICVTMLALSSPLYEVTLTARRIAFVVGNEGEGVSDAISKLATARVRIPMQAGVESLNVGAAAAVVLFEWRRQNNHG
jgi:RNA methyltransferase, TrmH family